MLFTDSRVRLADILDGSSHTVMAGERPPSQDLMYGRWYGGWGPWGFGNAFLGVRETDVVYQDCPHGPYRFESDRWDSPCAVFHFRSFHPRGANFLFADGSVRFPPYSAEPIMGALATRAGGETVDLPD